MHKTCHLIILLFQPLPVRTDAKRRFDSTAADTPGFNTGADTAQKRETTTKRGTTPPPAMKSWDKEGAGSNNRPGVNDTFGADPWSSPAFDGPDSFQAASRPSPAAGKRGKPALLDLSAKGFGAGAGGDGFGDDLDLDALIGGGVGGDLDFGGGPAGGVGAGGGARAAPRQRPPAGGRGAGGVKGSAADFRSALGLDDPSMGFGDDDLFGEELGWDDGDDDFLLMDDMDSLFGDGADLGGGGAGGRVNILGQAVPAALLRGVGGY